MKFLKLALIALSFGSTSSQQQQPSPLHFDVVSVRPTGNDRGEDPAIAQAFREARRGRISRGSDLMTSPGRLRLIDWPLLDLIASAYKVPLAQVSGPDWLAKTGPGFDVVANIPVGSSDQDVHLMLQSMLQERFLLRVHASQSMVAGYDLVVSNGGSKLRSATYSTPSQELSEADSQRQISQQLGDMHKAMAKATENGEAPQGSTYRSWQSIDLDEFATQLALLAKKPIMNKTHLDGRFAIRLIFAEGSDVFGSNLRDAVKELGLSLTPVKVLATEIVVDHANRSPTEN